MLRRDRFWRRDVTEEALFNYLTKPEFLVHTNLIYPSLIAIGVREDIAGQIASKMVGSLDGMNIKMNVQHVSLNDGMINTLDIRRERMVKSVIINETEDVMKDILLSIGYMVYIIGIHKGDMRKIVVTENVNSSKIFSEAIMKNPGDRLFEAAEATARFKWSTEKQIMYGIDSEGRFVESEEII